MEPATLTAAAIATLVVTKAFEKTGEMLGEKVVEQGANLTRLLRHKSPSTATAIELAQQQPLDYGQAVLELEAAAKTDPEIAQAVKEVEIAAKAEPNLAQAVQAVEETVKSQPSIINNFGKLAEKIANVYQSPVSIQNQNNTYQL